jgi:hypothetical protein
MCDHSGRCRQSKELETLPMQHHMIGRDS